MHRESLVNIFLLIGPMILSLPVLPNITQRAVLKQDWGALKYINWFGTVDFRIAVAGLLDSMGIIKIEGDIATPVTFDDGTSQEFFTNYSTIIDALIDISQP